MKVAEGAFLSHIAGQLPTVSAGSTKRGPAKGVL